MAKTISCGTCPWRLNVEGQHEILLVKPVINQGNWGIPKGHIIEGETLEECAIRETREETGFSVILGERLPTVTCRHRHETKDVISFLATPIETEPTLHRDDENVEVKWWPLSALPPVHKYQISLIDAIKEALIPREMMFNER